MKKVGLSLALLFLTSCGYSMFAGKTKAIYITPDGTRIEYESDKEQQNLHFKKTATTVEVSTDKAGAQESAVAAALQSQAALMDVLRELMPLLKPAAMAGS